MQLRIGIIRGSMPACALNPQCRGIGFLDATHMMCKFWKLNCSFSWYDGVDYGDVLENGTATGLVGAIARSEFDTSVPIFTPTYRRMKSIQFSEYFDNNQIFAVTRAPPASSEQFGLGIVQPFHLDVWLVFLFAYLLTAFALNGTIRIYSYIFSLQLTVSSAPVSMFISDIKTVSLKVFPFRLISAIWIIAIAILGSAYTSLLYSNSIMEKYKLPYKDINSLRRCLDRRECRLVSYTFGTAHIQQLFSADQIAHALLQKVSAIKQSILDEKNQYLVTVRQENTFLPQIDWNRDCKYYVTKLDYSQLNAFPIAKRSPYAELLNQIALTFRETGLEAVLNKKYTRYGHLCNRAWNSERKKAETHRTALAFPNMAIAICLSAAGWFISFLILMIEIQIANRRRRYIL